MVNIKYLFISVIFIGYSIQAEINITPDKNIDANDDRAVLIQMANGFLLSRALTTAAQLVIADYLVNKPKSAHDIAAIIGVKENMLYRLMRMLASHGIFEENENNEFALTSLGKLLVSDNPDTLRNFLIMDDKTRWDAYGNLKKAIKTGKTAFELTFDKGFFDYIKSKPGLQKLFDNGMHDISSNENISIVENLEIDNPESTSVVDVGGGKGGLLIDLKKKYPNLEAILFDYSPLDNDTKEILEKEKIDFRQGSFFDKKDIPEEKDIYILKRVLHDWANSECVSILQNCKEAMKKEGKIIVIDTILSSGNEYHIGKDIDIVMMTLFGGQERKQAEFGKLFSQAGLHITKIKPIDGTMLSIIELAQKS